MGEVLWQERKGRPFWTMIARGTTTLSRAAKRERSACRGQTGVSVMAAIRIGIVTVSDRASKGIYEDKGGPAIRDCLTEILSGPWEAVPRIIPDERPLIEDTLRDLCDKQGCCLVVTTGGTGPARRDVTPE